MGRLHTFGLEVGLFGDIFDGQCKRGANNGVEAEVIHKSRNVKVLEELTVIRIQRLGNFVCLVCLCRQLLHLIHEKLISAARCISTTCCAGEDCGGIALQQSPEVLHKDFHTVSINQLARVSKLIEWFGRGVRTFRTLSACTSHLDLSLSSLIVLNKMLS